MKGENEKMAYLVLATKRYNFKNNEGENVRGIKVTYCDEPVYDKDTKGFSPMTITVPIEFWPMFEHVPGLYDIDFRLKPDQKGKAQLVFSDASFVAPIEIPHLSGVKVKTGA